MLLIFRYLKVFKR